jgi:hypothetical protein
VQGVVARNCIATRAPRWIAEGRSRHMDGTGLHAAKDQRRPLEENDAALCELEDEE